MKEVYTARGGDGGRGNLRVVREALPEAGGRGTVCAKALWLEGAEEGWREANEESGIVQHPPKEGRGARGLAGIWGALKDFELRWGEHERPSHLYLAALKN